VQNEVSQVMSGRGDVSWNRREELAADEVADEQKEEQAGGDSAHEWRQEDAQHPVVERHHVPDRITICRGRLNSLLYAKGFEIS